MLNLMAVKDEVQALYDSLDNIKDPSEFVACIYKMADLITSQYPNVTCGKQICSHCCTNYSISISYLEAQYLMVETVAGNALRRLDIPSIKDSLIAAHMKGKLDNSSLGDCPFLSNHRCMVYEHRPMVCRCYFSIDDYGRCERGEAHHALNVTAHSILQTLNDILQEVSIRDIENGTLPVGEIRDYFKI